MTLRNVYCATLGEKSGHKTVCTTRPHDSYLRVYVCVCDRKSVVLARTTLEWKKSFSRPLFRVYVNVPKPLLSKGKVSGTDSPQHLLQTIHLSLTGILAGPGDGQTHIRPCWAQPAPYPKSGSRRHHARVPHCGRLLCPHHDRTQLAHVGALQVEVQALLPASSLP